MACNNNSCGTNSQGHGSHGSSCGCGSSSCGCGCGCSSGSCGCGSSCKCGGNKECDFAHKLLELADDAWEEVLYDKIKAKIEESCGKDLNELATIVSNSNKARWANKLNSKEACKNYEDQIAQFFGKKKC